MRRRDSEDHRGATFERAADLRSCGGIAAQRFAGVRRGCGEDRAEKRLLEKIEALVAKERYRGE